ncbi:MAG: phage tail tape measure protein, partial [Tetragenococcus koreensis]|nr:phage tail tape measure protein [Tetragenococcus koreensis]
MGSAMSKVMSKINTAVKDGGETMENFAQVSGMSGQEFATLWENDPYKAIMKFEGGVKEAVDQGQNHKTLLKELGITELRETDTVLRLANGNKQLADAREHANKGWKEGTALSDEAEKKYQSLGNQMKLFMNHVRALGIEIGAALTPVLKFMMKALTPVIDALAAAPAPIKLLVVALGLIPVIAVPVLASLAAITGAMGLMGQAMNTGAMAAGRNGRALRIYAGTMGLLTSPIATSRKALGLFSGSLAKVGTKSGKTSKALSGMPGVFRSTGKSTKGTTTIFQRLGKVMGALLMPFKLLLSPLKLLKGLMPLLGAGVRTLGLAFRILTGPIGIAVTILITLYKTIKYAYNNVEWFRKGVDGLVYTFKVFGGGIIETVIDNLKKLGNWFSKTGEWIKSKFTKDVQDSYKALDDDDLLKKGVEGFKSVMKTMGTATDKASDSVKVLGKGVSKETKKALGSYVKYSNSSNKILEQVKLNHGDISKKKATEILSIEEKLTNDLIEKLEKRKQEELKNAQEVFENSKALSQKEQDVIITGIEDRNNKAIDKEKELNAEIKRIKEEAMADGNISDKEMAQIEKLENERRELTVKNLTKTEKEQDKILSRMKNNREALSISEASSAIKGAEKARKARIKEINKEYDDKVYAIDQMVGLSKEQKEKLLDEAEDEKNKQIDKANEKKEGVVKSVKEQNKDIEKEMDTSNGKVYSNAEKWWKKTKEFLADDSLSQGFKKGMEGIGEWFSSQGAEFSKNFKEGWKTATQAGGD